ncbi:hypothetical protein [Roseivirga misakiensis]|uniref:Uncharacterized protein n=1 Tax=Roseivirga misakiensis TaxID=1563681 RepID=A0A1E5T0Y7_9BACT|nr:hypothetical protein [Roseivirga misakiensis]OEK05015.1 hypothetical protein BFP71_16470 [Roseivirga misakiensis]
MAIFKSKVKAESFVAVAAIIVSVCALAVSFYEVGIMRQQQKNSVWPYVEMGQQYDSEGFAFEASNKGVGPAIVKSLKVRAGQEQVNDLQELLTKMLGEDHGIGWNNYSIHNVNGSVLEPGYNMPMVRFQWNEKTRLLQKRIAKIRIEMIYQSIYGDCWQVVFGGVPKPCDCPVEIDKSEQFSF